MHKTQLSPSHAIHRERNTRKTSYVHYNFIHKLLCFATRCKSTLVSRFRGNAFYSLAFALSSCDLVEIACNFPTVAAQNTLSCCCCDSENSVVYVKGFINICVEFSIPKTLQGYSHVPYIPDKFKLNM